MIAEALGSNDPGMVMVALAGLELIDPVIADQIDAVRAHQREQRDALGSAVLRSNR